MSVTPLSLPDEPQSRPIRVGFVLHVMQVAGAEVLVKEAIRRLGDAITPTVFCLDRVGQLGEEHLANGGDLVCLNRRPGRDFRVSWNLAKEIRKRKIDVIHAHQYSPFFYAAFAKLLARPMPRLILTEHGRHYPDIVSPNRRAFNRIVLDRAADAVNACCGFSAKAMRDLDGFRGGRIEVIENGIEVDRYSTVADKSELRHRFGLNAQRRYLAHVARHHPVKDQNMLIRAFALAAASIPDVDLLMVGDGPLRGELEELTRTLGIADRVIFLGIRSDVPDVLRVADAFALTSVSEAASLTLLEAMATGLPVVVTNVGGNPEIIRHEREGLLVPRGDAKACGEAFTRLMCDPELAARLGKAGRERAVEKYQLEQTVRAYHRLYRRLTGI